MNRLTNKRSKVKVWDGFSMHYPPMTVSKNESYLSYTIDDTSHSLTTGLDALQKSFLELQYIGFIDGKGEELYESDIITYQGKHYVILWNPFSCAFNFFTLQNGNFRPNGPIWFTYQREIQKVGNLLENKDFLLPYLTTSIGNNEGQVA